MDAEKRCRQCGAILSADVPHGICPACALTQGLGEGADDDAAASPMSQDEIPTLAELASRFPDLEIMEMIGKGGMGAVYKARQKSLDRLVALKVLSPAVGRDPAFAERFSREAKALAKLSHPRIVAIYDSGEAGGLYYLMMEYVEGAEGEGTNLRQFMQQHRPTPQQAIAIVGQICDGLQYAHDSGVIHRDIKPENILLDKNMHVKITDFGLVRLLGDERADLLLTEPGTTMGTAYYMAPEQLIRPEEVDHRADIYSTGVVLYQLLTGELPVGHFAAPSQKAQVARHLDNVVLKALATDPQSRYQQAQEMRAALENAPSQRAAVLLVTGIAAGVLLAITVVVVLLVIGVKGFLASNTATPAPPQAPTQVRTQPAPGQKFAAKAWTGTRSPLMRAIDRSPDEVREMIAEGYDVNELSRDGTGAPLHGAAYEGDRGYTAARLLVEAGADVNVRNESWGTPLMIAAANNGEKLASYLIANGAQVNATDRQGRRALDFAEYHKCEAVAALLKAEGAIPGTGVHVPAGKTRATKVEAMPPATPVASTTMPADVAVLDPSGEWSLKNAKLTFTVSFKEIEPGRYKLLPESLVYAGVYEQRGNQFIMIQPESPAYTDFVWHIQDEDHLELTNSDYKGSTLTRQSP